MLSLRTLRGDRVSEWSEICPYCKGYPGYDRCECPEQVLAARAARQELCMCLTTEGEWRPCPPQLCEREDHDHYFCGSNYCDDPACVGEHPERL